MEVESSSSALEADSKRMEERLCMLKKMMSVEKASRMCVNFVHYKCRHPELSLSFFAVLNMDLLVVVSGSPVRTILKSYPDRILAQLAL